MFLIKSYSTRCVSLPIEEEQNLIREFIIEKLQTLIIKNKEKLVEYVDFCINKNLKSHTKRKTERHHILLRSIFEEYSDLRKNCWNATYLTYEDHYIAHSILAEAVNHNSIIFAWWNMHSLNINKIDLGEDILESERYSELRKLHYDVVVSQLPHLVNRSKETIQRRNDTMAVSDENGITEFQRNGQKISLALSNKVYSFNLKTQQYEHLDKMIYDKQWYSVGRTAKYKTLYEYNGIFYEDRVILCNQNNIDVLVMKKEYGNNKPYKRLKLDIIQLIENFEYYNNKIYKEEFL
jgi:hypothetical protein